MQRACISRAVTRLVCRSPFSTTKNARKRNSPEVQAAVAEALQAQGFPPETVRTVSEGQCSIEQVNATLQALETKVGLSKEELHKLAARSSTLFKVDVAKRLDILLKCIHENDVPMYVFRKLLLRTKSVFVMNEDRFRNLSENVELIIPFYKRMDVPMARWFQYRLSVTNPLQLESSFRFLVDFAGEEGARKIIQRHSRIMSMDIEKRLKTNLQPLRDFGMTNEQLLRAVGTYPRVLDLSQDKMFLPKRAFFEELGFSECDFVKLLVSFPKFAAYSEKEFHRKLEFMVDYCGIPKQVTGVIFKKSPAFLSFSIEKQLKPKVDYLRTLGITGKRLENLFKCHCAILFKNMDSLKARINRFDKLGLTRDQYFELVKRQPSILNYADELMREKMAFLKRFTKAPVDLLITYPPCFTLALEARVKPRLRFVAWLHLNGHMRKDYPFSTILKRTEPQFLKLYVAPFNEEAAAAYAYYHGHV